MLLDRSDDGIWALEAEPEDSCRQTNSYYMEALPRYLTCLDTVFTRARATSEFYFLLSIFAIRGVQDAGWDPHETTRRVIDSVRQIANDIEGEAEWHLSLWLYGHIMEASEPYEFLSNLIDVAGGGYFKLHRFPPGRPKSPPLSPEKKIEQLTKQALAVDLPDVVIPMSEAWNRDLRNAIFHADYCLYATEVRTLRPMASYQLKNVLKLINRAMAYHEALEVLRKYHISSYKKPTRIQCGPGFSSRPGEEAVVIVRSGYGVVGMKDAWSLEQLKQGHIAHRIGRFSQDELKLLSEDPTLALLPARE